MVNADINLTPTATLFEVDAGTGAASNGARGSFGKITGRSWGTGSECQAAVILIHGLGAHSGWFEALARRLKVRKIFVLSFDLVGFGKRIKQRYRSPKQWLDDLVTAYAYLKSIVGEKPIYLVGNSMGAIVALQGCPIVKPAGLALLSPAFEGHPKTFPISYRIEAVIQALTKPDQEMQLPYNVELVASQKSVRDWLNNDPERRFAVPGRMMFDLLKITQSLRWSKLSVICPTLMLTAGNDRLIDNRVNHKIFARLACAKKHSRNFENASHDLPLDPVVEDVAEEIVDWISNTHPLKAMSSDTTSNTVPGTTPQLKRSRLSV